MIEGHFINSLYKGKSGNSTMHWPYLFDWASQLAAEYAAGVVSSSLVMVKRDRLGAVHLDTGRCLVAIPPHKRGVGKDKGQHPQVWLGFCWMLITFTPSWSWKIRSPVIVNQGWSVALFTAIRVVLRESCRDLGESFVLFYLSLVFIFYKCHMFEK